MTREALEAVLTSGVVMTVPLLLAALGELFAECAGVINIGVEGMMLVGALGGVVGAFHGHSPWLGLLAGVAAGVAFAGLFALIVVGRGADQVVAGTALNLLALGLTGAVYRAMSEHLTVPLIAPAWTTWAVPGLSRLPLIGQPFFQRNAPAYLAYLLVPTA